MRALKMRSTVAGHLKLTTTIWEPSSKLILLQRHKTLPENSTSTILQSFGMKQIRKVKKLSKCVSCELTTNQKNCHFEVSSSLILCNNNKPFLYWIVMCGKWILYDNWQWPTQLSGLAEKKLQSASQSQTCTKKKDMALVWWSAACLIHCSFLNPGETITFEKYAQQIKEMQPHLKPALINRKGPILLHDKAQLNVVQPALWKLN